MKKLMLFVAVAGLAFASQAMQLDWQYNASAADVGKTVYVLLGSTAQTEWESIAALASAAVDSSSVAKSGRVYNATGTADNDAITKTSANVYYVVVSADEKSFDVSSVADMTASVYDVANQESGSGANISISSSSTFVATGSSFGGGGTTPVVPEPTSGLLMIVGLGALALRRRRA